MVYEQAFADLRDRLIALVDNPPYRFRDTLRAAAIAHSARRSSFFGVADAKIDAAEREMGIKFPGTLRTYFQRMGTEAGDLFRGSDRARLTDLLAFRLEANALVQACGADPLPETAIVFLFHQGYSFSYQLGVAYGAADTAPDDGPVFTYVEGDPAPRQAAPSLMAFLEAEVEQHEEVSRMFHEQGGYYLTISNGQVREQYPALSARPRPLDTADQFVD